MHITRTALALAASTAALLLLAGCTSAAPASSSDGSAPATSPLGTYLDAMYGLSGSPDEQKATEDAEQAEVQGRIASCMAQQGFTYRPQTRSYRDLAGGDAEWKPNDRDWVAQWGYGAVDYPGDTGSAAEKTDPNAAYLETLSSSERAAWETALYGSASGEGSTGSDERLAEAGGCWGQATEEASSDPLSTDQFAPLLDAMNQFEEQQARWPGQAQLDAEWSACMAEAGRSGIPSPRDAQDRIFTQVSDLAKKDKGSEKSSSTARTPEMDAMKKTEVEMALADLDCRQKTDYDARAEKVRWTAEEQFVADHKAELDAAKAAAEQSQARS